MEFSKKQDTSKQPRILTKSETESLKLEMKESLAWMMEWYEKREEETQNKK